MNEVLISRIRQCPALPSLPAAALEIVDLVQRPEVDTSQIARAINKDPALASKILRTANSSFYARGNSVGTLSRALVVLGLQSVKTLALGFSLANDLRQKGFEHADYWRRSIYATTAARTLATTSGIVQVEEACLVGLLADVGVLVLHHILAADYDRVCDATGSHDALPAAEQSAFGLNHANVSGILAEHWKLPPVLALPMAHHHTPNELADPALRKIAQIANVAGLCADVFINKNPAPAIALVRKLCLEHFEMSESQADALLSEIGSTARQVAPLFEVRLPTADAYEKILQRAHEALVNMALRPNPESAPPPAEELKPVSAADTPPKPTILPTDLPDRTAFKSVLAEQFLAASAHSLPLSQLLIEVEQLGDLNAKTEDFGAEKLMKWIGQQVTALKRPRDFAARFRAGQIAMLLPATERTLAAAIAEALRRALTTRQPSPGQGHSSPVIVSVGVATYEPGSPLKEPAHLNKATELALAAAQRSGRNCVRVFTLPKTASVCTVA